MPLRGPDNKEYDGSQDEWTDSENEGTGELLKKMKKLLSPTEPEPEPENLQLPPPPSDEETTEEAVQRVAELLSKEDILVTGDKDEQTGMLPVILRKVAEVSAAIPAQRGRHVGGRALAVLSRMPLVGLKYLRDSAEFVVYDDQPPPSGEYAVQALGVTTIEYDGVKQNHLLVTFKAGQLTGFGIENTYESQETTYGVAVDTPVDINTPLGSRSARTIVIECNRNIQVKLNSATSDSMSISANQTPFVIDLGLNIDTIYLTTFKSTKVRIKGW
jgi:hypothetical protein